MHKRAILNYLGVSDSFLFSNCILSNGTDKLKFLLNEKLLLKILQTLVFNANVNGRTFDFKRQNICKSAFVNRMKNYNYNQRISTIMNSATNVASMSTWTLRVNFLGQLQCIGVCEIRISRRDGKNQAILAIYEFKNHVTDLNFDVLRLITNCNFSQSRKINQRQVENFQQTTSSKISTLPTNIWKFQSHA